jgi:nucleoside-diphosphate-sugar epimerase
MNAADGASTGQSQVYLVTGGAGMLGRALVSQLVEKGKTVRIIDIEPAQDERAEIIVGDVRDADAVRKACDGVDTVFHAAAAVWDSNLPSSIYSETNVIGTQIVIDTCIQLKISRLVYTSTMDVIMDCKHGQRDADESLPYPADPKKMNRYAYSKMLGEQAILKANSPALATCALRPVGMFGPGDKYHLPNIIKNAKHGVNIRLGDGTAQFSHVFSGNVAHAHILAAENLAPGSPVAGQAYFITDGHDGNFFSFMDPFLESLGIPVPKRSIPYGVANVLAWFSEKVSPRSNLNRFSVYCICLDHTFVHSKATRDFGYEPRYSAKEAFEITLEWLKTQQF